MEGYKEYKKVNSLWYDNIPSGWNIVQLKRISNIYTGNSLNDSQKELYSKELETDFLNYVSSKDINVNNTSCNYNTGTKIPKATDKLKIAKTSSTLMCIEGGSAGKKITSLQEDVFFVNKLACINAKDGTYNKFLFYYLQSNEFKSQFENSLSGLIGGVSLSNLNNFQAIKPSLEEQQKIAEYLDYKTATIDEIIAKKQKLIAALDEKKKSIINDIVTGKKVWNGSIFTTPTQVKDSGIQWLGQIPEHWEVKRLGHLGVCQNGVSKGGDYFGSGFPFVNYGDIYKNFALPEKVEGLANSSEEDQNQYSVKEGDVFFTRTSETIDEIGIASTCLKTIDKAVFSGFTIRFRQHEEIIIKDYSKYLFRSDYIRTSLTKEMNLITRASLSQMLLKSLSVLLPPKEEQYFLSNYLDNKIQELDLIKSKINTQIEKIKEYRQAVIAEAVTGKIDVRHWNITNN